MDEACPKCGEDDGIAGKCAAMFVAKNAEIVSHRAKLDEAYQLGRQASWDQAQATIDGLRAELAEQTELSASALERCAELAERLAPLRATASQDAEALDREKAASRMWEQAYQNENIGAQRILGLRERDAEEKARLREALINCAESLAAARERLGMCGEGDGKDRNADAPDDIGSLAALTGARAALACTPTGVPNGGQRAAEIARLTKLLAWMVEWFGDDDPTAQVVIDSRAVLACRPHEKHTVLDDIAAERRRQVNAEGWTADHDDTHAAGELACAAACYAEGHLRHCWPWDRQWWKPTTPRQNYIKAAALLVAEIERLDRLACRPQGEKSDVEKI